MHRHERRPDRKERLRDEIDACTVVLERFGVWHAGLVEDLDLALEGGGRIAR